MKACRITSIRNLLALGAITALYCRTATAAPTTAYPQPQPSNDEQYMLELINRARANPSEEGQRLAGITDPTILQYYNYYKVDTALMAQQFGTYAARQPLAMNADLMTSSREQSLDQATNGFQGHDGTNGSTFNGRITATGYDWSFCGENVYAYAEDAYFCHVGFNADWGVPSLDHRENIMNTDNSYPIFREIGISCVGSTVKGFGPMVVTQDFGTPLNSTVAYVLGVVYNDANNDGFYESGEGLGAVTVSSDTGAYYAITPGSGGFVLPLPASGSGTITLTASGGGLGAPRVKTVSYTAGTNVKVDFTTADPVQALPMVALSATSKDARVTNGQDGDITLSRTGSTAKALTVAFTFGGTAVNGVDCNKVPSTLTIPAGSGSVSFTVRATNRSLAEVAKFKIFLAASSAYTVTPTVSEEKVRIRIHGANN